MPLDWKEIANRARAFSKDWKHAARLPIPDAKVVANCDHRSRESAGSHKL